MKDEVIVSSDVPHHAVSEPFAEKIEHQITCRRKAKRNALTGLFHEDGNNHAVHTEHTSHDDGDDRFEEEVRLEDADGHNTDTRLGSAVGRAKVGEDEGRSDSHGTEENSLVGVAVSCSKFRAN